MNVHSFTCLSLCLSKLCVSLYCDSESKTCPRAHTHANTHMQTHTCKHTHAHTHTHGEFMPKKRRMSPLRVSVARNNPRLLLSRTPRPIWTNQSESSGVTPPSSQEASRSLASEWLYREERTIKGSLDGYCN